MAGCRVAFFHACAAGLWKPSARSDLCAAAAIGEEDPPYDRVYDLAVPKPAPVADLEGCVQKRGAAGESAEQEYQMCCESHGFSTPPVTYPVDECIDACVVEASGLGPALLEHCDAIGGRSLGPRVPVMTRNAVSCEKIEAEDRRQYPAVPEK